MCKWGYSYAVTLSDTKSTLTNNVKGNMNKDSYNVTKVQFV